MVTDDLYSRPMDGEAEIEREATQRIVNSDKFFSKVLTPSGREFFIFSEQGDYVKGILLAGARDNSHINRSKSYQIKARDIRQHGQDLGVDGVEIEEFFANRQLQRLLRKLAGKCVRIVYIGRVKSGWGGHSAKTYRVFVDKGFFEESEEEIYETKPGKTRRSKSASIASGR